MKIPDGVREALEETGLPWDIEQGKKHHKIRLAGRFVGIFTRGKFNTSHNRSTLNVISQIRRAAREIKSE